MATLSAQDIITLKSGDEIKAKVQEIGTDNVKYKKYDNQSGPIYTLTKSDIFMIKYENGDKDVFNTPAQPVQEKPVSPPAGVNVPQNDYSQINAMTKRGNASLREKNYEIGIQGDFGLGSFHSSDFNGEYEDENNFGFMAGGGLFLDIYPKKNNIWLLGTGANYWSHYYMTDYDATYSLSYVNWDVYWGARDPLAISGVRLYAKLGLRASFLTGGTISFADGSEDKAKLYANSTVFGMMTEWGYPFKHFDIGVKGFWMFTNIWKSDALSGGDLSSNLWGVTFTCAYRFSF
jgi:hypothetical protein